MSKTFFIADDDADDHDFFMDALKAVCATCTLLQAYNGEEALDFLDKQLEVPDFIFLDLNMPKLSGKQCLKEIKNNAKLRDVPVIIYTTSTVQTDKDETLHLGAAQYLVKPTSLQTLKQELVSLMQRTA